jgi:hypothetical protein
MNGELESKLRLDLRKSGFYSEMMAIHACTAAKWQCHGSFTYFDKDERTTRECDFEAVREWGALGHQGTSLQIIARLLGQVKKSEHPWIVFMDRQVKHPRFADGWDNIIDTSATEQERIGDVLRQHALVTRKGWLGTGIHEAFKRPSDGSRWYSAFVSACKAAESAFDTAAAAPRPEIYFELIKPVVVLDGCLFGAELAADGEIVLTETDSATFAFEYRSDAYERPRYFLDVVTLDAFPRYLEAATARMIDVIEALRR